MKYRNLAVLPLSLMIGSTAFAADFSEPNTSMAPIVGAVGGYDWSGFYAGIHGGFGWSNVDWNWSNSTTAHHDGDGWTVGGTIGANMQTENNVVLGVEGDLSWADINGSTPCPNALYTCSHDVEWTGTVRARLGYAMDQTLVYVTGGVAFAGTNYSTQPGPLFFSDYDDTHVGWTAGAGAEFAVSDRFSLNLMYLYMDLGSVDSSMPNLSATATANLDLDIHRVTIGGNIKLGGG